MSNLLFSSIENRDLEKCKDIYTYYIENTTATFHIGEIADEEMKEILFPTDKLYESFKILKNNEIIGYVLISPFKKREAYRRSAEVTLYLKPTEIGQGIGTLAIEFIESVALAKGIKSLLAIICGENINSIKLFEKNGYFKCGHMKNVGEKFGRLLDIVTYEKEI